MRNPFLDDSFHPDWAQLKPECIQADTTLAIELAEKNLATIRGLASSEVTFANVVKALEQATAGLDDCWGKVSHLDSVCNSDELRVAYNEMLPKVSAFEAKIALDPDLWSTLQTFAETDEAKNLTDTDKRLFEETMADFREAGADLSKEKRDRLEAISEELAKVTQKFSENVLDSTNVWDLIIKDESKLAGLPDSAKDAALQSAKDKLEQKDDDEPCWRFTLQAPSISPVLEYLDDDSIRKEIWEAATKIGWQGDWENTDAIKQILSLRLEKATLLGKNDFADVALSRRMAKNGQKADTFVSDLRDKTAQAFSRENKELEAFKAQKTEGDNSLLEPWEVAYWAEKQKQELYAFDEEELRPYFPIDSVLSGMFSLVSNIFGLRIEERSTSFDGQPANVLDGDEKETVPVWHPEVKFYEIYDDDTERHLGSFYADWHPRESKRAGAWMNFLKTGELGKDGSALGPHLGLMCGNMTASTEGKPALLTHREVETVFHEFGHLLHHLCSEVKHKSLSGVNVAWDFVELPSQIMENWCWERDSLDLFALHHETGETIPEELFKKMLRARNYMTANAMMRQLCLGKMDLELHRKLSVAGYENLDASLDEVLQGYVAERKTKPPSIVRRFSHLFGNPVGYACAYYSYKWAEVLDADAFTRFKKEGVMNGETGRSFRTCILSRGNSKPADELFRDFMGRDPDPDALLVRSGLSAN